MKRVNNIFDKVVDAENIAQADQNARRGKKNYYGVRKHDKHREANLRKLKQSFEDLTYKTSPYHTFKIYEPKEREIFRLPYFPDRIAHHALMLQLESVWEKVFYEHSYACRKNKGIHAAVKNISRILKSKKGNTKYCLKLDIRKFYPSIDHDILKEIIRKKIKDKKILVILDEIIDSTPGVPIGNYLSQYFANLYVTYFDHWLKEVKKVKYYYRYADDMVILADNKEWLYQLQKEIAAYLKDKLKLDVKPDWRIFEVDKLGIDFIGYKFYHGYTLLRKSIKEKIKKLIHKINKFGKSRNWVRKRLSSYSGWLKYCDSHNFFNERLKDTYEKYRLPSPDYKMPKATEIISNIVDRPVRIVGFKVYDKYFKAYFITNKLVEVRSTSKSLYKLFVCCHFNPYKQYIVKFKKNRYEISIDGETKRNTASR